MKKWICLLCLLSLLLTGCGSAPAAPENAGRDFAAMAPTASLPLDYATQFSVDFYGDLARVRIGGDGDYLLLPQGAELPRNLPEGMTVIPQPAARIYLAATSAMDLYRAAGCMDAVKLSSLNAAGWFLPEAKAALEAGEMVYAGKYSAPDYELIFDTGCDLAVESTMIYHTPEVKEQLERLGIPVLVERSSYEAHPLGRLEWMKLHGLLTGHPEEAAAAFQEAVDRVRPVMEQPAAGKTVAFFSVNSTGTVTVRKASDYVAKTIALAGGTYLFSDLDSDEATSTMNMQMETFFDRARDADVLIYNSTTAGELFTLDDLYAQSSLFRQFKAVESGSVYCTGRNLFQETTALAPLIGEIHTVLTQDNPQGLQYLHPLR